MQHTYNITGMTCGGCVSKVKSQLLKLGDVTQAEVQLTSPNAVIQMDNHIPINVLQGALSKAGSFVITESHENRPQADEMAETTSWFQTYKPVLIIGLYLLAVSTLIEVVGEFSWHSWMQNFMAGFFLVFSFFKMLDLRSFADSYSSYDIIAKQWHGWGYVYAFTELALGIAYLTRFNPLVTNFVAIVVMSISLIGVLQSVLNKRKIQCACLGTVFKLPMSTITII